MLLQLRAQAINFVRFFAKAGAPLRRDADALIRKHPTVKLVDENGKLLSTPMNTASLLHSPPHPGLQLVIIDERQSPPVARFASISDEFNRSQARLEAETRARLANRIKEMHFGVAVSDHDYSVKLAKVRQWIEEKGWKVRIKIEDRNGPQLTQRLKKFGLNHERTSLNPKQEMMHKITQQLAGWAETTATPELERGSLFFTLQPNQKMLSAIKTRKQ